MKKLICTILSLCTICTLTACKSGEDPAIDSKLPTETTSHTTETVPETEAPAFSSQLPLTAVFMPVITKEEKADDGTVIYSQVTQNLSLTVQDPDIADKVIVDYLNRVDMIQASGKNILDSAKENYTPENWNPYLCQLLYSPQRVDQGILSLFGDYVEYAGRNHANKTNRSINYDLTNGDVLTLAGILKIDAGTELFPKLVIESLKEKEQELHLYSGFQDFVTQRFDTDSSTDEAFYFTPTGICFYFSPYEIAPYSSGTISVEIPYEKLVDIVDDSYFPAETQFTDGTLQVMPFNPENADGFKQITEAIIDENGTMLLAKTEDTIHHVSIVLKDPDGKNPDRIIFAAQALCPGDAVVIQASQEDLANLTITYENNSGVQEIQL